jgi:hypothetical protein
MVTIEQILAYSERMIAERYLAGDREALRRLQLALGVLMDAANDAGDHATATHLRNLAAKAANRQEDLGGS